MYINVFYTFFVGVWFNFVQFVLVSNAMLYTYVILDVIVEIQTEIYDAFTRYAHNQMIGKPSNFKSLWARQPNGLNGMGEIH